MPVHLFKYVENLFVMSISTLITHYQRIKHMVAMNYLNGTFTYFNDFSCKRFHEHGAECDLFQSPWSTVKSIVKIIAISAK